MAPCAAVVNRHVTRAATDGDRCVARADCWSARRRTRTAASPQRSAQRGLAKIWFILIAQDMPKAFDKVAPLQAALPTAGREHLSLLPLRWLPTSGGWACESRRMRSTSFRRSGRVVRSLGKLALPILLVPPNPPMLHPLPCSPLHACTTHASWCHSPTIYVVQPSLRSGPSAPKAERVPGWSSQANIWPNIGPKLANHRPSSAPKCVCMAEVGPNLVEVCQCWPSTPTEIWSTSARNWSTSDGFGRNWPQFDRSNLVVTALTWSTMATLAVSGPKLPELGGPLLADIGSISADSGRAQLSRHRPVVFQMLWYEYWQYGPSYLFMVINHVFETCLGYESLCRNYVHL